MVETTTQVQKTRSDLWGVGRLALYHGYRSMEKSVQTAEFARNAQPNNKKA